MCRRPSGFTSCRGSTTGSPGAPSLHGGTRSASRHLPLDLPPDPGPELTHAWHLYPVQTGDACPLGRDALLDSLTRQNIGVGVHYRGVHLQPYYRDKYSLRPEQFPEATRISERVLSLPLSPKLSFEDQDDVVDALEVSTST